MTNVIKFQAPFERIKFYNYSPEVSLMKAIITQAIIDATNISLDKLSKKSEIEAKAWIFGNSEEFKTICLGAEMDPNFVIKIANEVIQLHKNNNNLRRNDRINSKRTFKTTQVCSLETRKKSVQRNKS
jgi:hypothetical protein